MGSPTVFPLIGHSGLWFQVDMVIIGEEMIFQELRICLPHLRNTFVSPVLLLLRHVS